MKCSDSGDPIDITVVLCIVYLKAESFFLKTKFKVFFPNIEIELYKISSDYFT